MKAAIICPTGLLGTHAVTDYHLLLPHVAWEDKAYEDHYYLRGQAGEYLILDNSVIELGHPVNFNDMRGSILRIQPDEVALPDLPGQPDTTFFMIKESAARYKDEFPNIKLMAIPQAPTVAHWLMYHDKILEACPEIDVIGIPKSLRTNRPIVCKYLDEGQRDESVQYHLLGTWGNPVEIRFLSRYKWIRGVDSKAPVRFGQAGVAFHAERGILADFRDAIPPLRFDYPDDYLAGLTQLNVETFIRWAEGKL